MKISINFNAPSYSSQEKVVLAAFATPGDKGKALVGHWPRKWREAFGCTASSPCFTGKEGTDFSFSPDGKTLFVALGLGEKKKVNEEKIRRAIATLYRTESSRCRHLSIDLDSFAFPGGEGEASVRALTEGLFLSAHQFDRYKKGPPVLLKEVVLDSQPQDGTKKRGLVRVLEEAQMVCESVNFARNLIDEPPNILHSTEYARRVVEDVKKNLPGVGVKVLGKTDLEKEKMGLFLSVNAGSAHPPQLVHLTYTPKGASRGKKHIALVGKGLTFDTGGYSIKPGASMISMKYDMAGSATVYGAFRASVLAQSPLKISCFLGITDNAINEHATMPDSIVVGRKGLSVEILNTDAEGRLVLGDVLDYASSFKPHVIIDAATLTGACIVALGKEVCGLMGNDQKLKSHLAEAAQRAGESIWELPIIDEFRKDMESPVADLRNIGSERGADTAKAGAFLERFVGKGIAWAHLDIAGGARLQSHLPYCPPKGASGIMVRTLFNYLCGRL